MGRWTVGILVMASLIGSGVDGFKGEKDGVKQEMDGYKADLTPEQIDALLAFTRALAK